MQTYSWQMSTEFEALETDFHHTFHCVRGCYGLMAVIFFSSRSAYSLVFCYWLAIVLLKLIWIYPYYYLIVGVSETLVSFNTTASYDQNTRHALYVHQSYHSYHFQSSECIHIFYIISYNYVPSIGWVSTWFGVTK